MEEGIFEFGRWGQLQFVIAAVVVSLLGLLLSWVTRLSTGLVHRGRGYYLPPGPKGWPLVGGIPYLGKFPQWSFFELSKKYGPIMYMRLGPVSTLVISNGEMAREVYQTNDLNFASRPALLVPRCLTYGQQDIGWAPYGSHWRQVRKLANLQLLTTSRVVNLTGVMNQEVLNTIHTVLEQSQSGGKDNGNVNISTIFGGMAMNIITQVLWSKRHRNIKGSQSHYDKHFHELIRNIMAVAGADNIADFLGLHIFKSFAMKVSGLESKTKKVHKDLDKFFETIISEKEQALSKETKAAADEDDFVTVMLKLMNQDGDSLGLSRVKIKAILVDLLLGGTDTSAITMDWTMAQLMRHPHMMKKAQAELTAVVGEDRLVRESDIPNLKYLDALLKEALRKHSPAALGMPHLSQADCKIGGYDVPANTLVFFNLIAIHHDSNVWENPMEFNPDRFLQSELEYKGRNFEFIPFGSGRRMCPGYNLASKFLHLALAQLLHAVTWSLPEGQKPESMDMSENAGAIASRATPLLVSAKPRLAHHIIYPSMAL